MTEPAWKAPSGIVMPRPYHQAPIVDVMVRRNTFYRDTPVSLSVTIKANSAGDALRTLDAAYAEAVAGLGALYELETKGRDSAS